jgi:hypothetical protein
MRRRRLLHVSGIGLAVLLTGCSTENTNVADIAVANRTEAPQSVTLVVTRLSDDSPVLSEAFDIEVDEYRQFDDPIKEASGHRVEVEVQNGPSDSFEWDVPADEAVGLDITLRPSSIEFQEIAA